MAGKSPPCNPRTIELYLADSLADDEVRQFEAHLDDCESCCHVLHDSAADATWWTDAQQYLGNTALSPESEVSRWAVASDHDRDHRHAEVPLGFLAPTDDPRMLGRIGGYEIAGVVGHGGMGIVLKGFDTALNRFVAIKVLAPHLASSGAARDRFAREAIAAAAVVHENVIAIHGVAEHGGLPYLVMPYVRGTSLQRRLSDGGPLETIEVLRIAVQCSAGLAAAHAQGLVHRDIKPANILLSDGVERIKITDFGLARAVDDASLTRTGVVAGTPQFMSPEQANGEAVDHRSDLFSLGSVIYTMCTGRPPFRADTSLAVLRRIADTAPRSIRELNPRIPVWLCQIVERLHCKSPDLRYSSAEELQCLLEQCLAHAQNGRVALPQSLQRCGDRPRARSRHWVIGLMSCGVLGVAAILGTLPPRPVATPEQTLPAADTPQPPANRPLADVTADSTLMWDDEVDQALSVLKEKLRSLDQQSRKLLP